MIKRQEIIEHAIKIFGENFKFRERQLETIEDILQTFFEGEKNLYLLDAPTGSGKSIIAVLFASILNEYNLKGYILASDLSLFEQYVNSIDRIDRFGHLKGADNYTCAVNSEKFSFGECRLQNVSYEDAEELPCFRDCGYLMNRRRAIRSSTAVTTYSYWLIQRNYVEGKMLDKGKSVPFPIRDFTICDEAHKIPEIIQNHFSPRIGMDAVTKIEDMYAFLVRKGFPTPRKSPSSMRSLVNKILREDEQEKIFFSLKELELALSEYTKCGNGMKESMTLSSKELLKSKEWRVAFAQVDFIKDLHCKFEDYNHIISQVGLDYMIKNPQDSGNVVFNCLEESYMMNRHFHEQSKFKLLMTATMGDPKDFMAAIGATKCRYQKMDSRFNFDRSPIHFYPQYRMSMNKRDENFNWMKKKVEEILASHPDECGIIHSGSYENAAKIYAQLEQNKRSRIITYTNSQEKTSALIEFADSKNSVLIGPSLLEGLDLFEDKSRFQIFLKVPFPSLGDKFVNAKMNYAPAWYDWKTCIAILQGIGRSVRSKDDWAVTYFLDGCLADLFKRRRSSFPLEFQKRIVINKD